jgi:hypothetical protein
VANLRPRPFRQLSNRNLTNRNLKSKKQLRAHPATWARPFRLQGLLAEMFLAVFPVDFPAGS